MTGSSGLYFSGNLWVPGSFVLGFFGDLAGPVWMKDGAWWSFLGYLLLVLGAFLGLLVYLTWPGLDGSRYGGYLVRSREKMTGIWSTWQEAFWGKVFFFFPEKFYPSRFFPGLWFGIHGCLVSRAPRIQTSWFLWGVFLSGDLRFHLLFLPLSLCSWS